MNSSLQFHAIYGEHIKLSRNNTVAKRVDSFCKGICFSNRTIQLRERVYVRLLNKSVQWTGFLRLGVTTCDPLTHRTSTALPRHACPDLTCRPGYWAKCVPENCFDVTNKLTYFYVDENGELFLNTPNGEISLLTGISTHEPLWALLDIYGNCISIELAEDPQARSASLNDQLRVMYPTANQQASSTTPYFKDIRTDLIPLPFLPVHSASIDFFSLSNNGPPNQSIALFDHNKSSDGLVFFSEPLTVNSALLIHILGVSTSNETRQRITTTAAAASSTALQFGLTNCNTKTLLRSRDLPIDLDQMSTRTECWIVHDFKTGTKPTIDRDDEFLFTLTSDGIVQYSHNNSLLNDLIHIDSNLVYYPFLVFRGDIIAVHSVGRSRNIDKFRASQQQQQQANNNSNASKKLARELSTRTVSSENEGNGNDSKLYQDCSICLDRRRDTVLIPCGHICLCYSCAKELLEQGTKQCPICRSSITLINKIYLA